MILVGVIRWCAVLGMAAATCTACGGGGDGDGDDDGSREDGAGGTGSSQGAVGAGTGAGSSQSGCFEAFPGSWSLHLSGGPSPCKGYDPIECDVDQNGCVVTIECPKFGGTMSLEIGADGTTESAQIPIGDGVVAQCHAEFSESFGTSVGDVFSMTLVCSAMGVECEYGESKVFTD